MSSQQTLIAFENQIDVIQDYLDSMVDEGSDQELFIAGYLNGHFSLAVSRCQLKAELTIAAVDTEMRESLKGAFDNNELEADDQQAVYVFWQRCVEKAGA